MLAPDSTPTDPRPSTAPPARLRALAPRLVASLLIAAGFVWLLQRGGLPMLPPSAALAQLQWWGPVLYVALTVLGTVLRTYRWVHLLRPIEPRISARHVLGTSLVSFAAVVFAPLRMGEVARPWLISRSGAIGFMQATGTVAAERVVDGLLLMTILGASLWLATPLSPLPDHIGELQLPVALIPTIATTALLTFATAFAVMTTFYFFRDLVTRLVNATVSLVSAKLARWLIQQLERVSDGLRFLPSRKHGGAFLRDSLVYWGATALALWVMLRGVGAPASFAEACVIMGVMGLGALLPSGPGFFGTYQLGAYCGLALFFPEATVLGAGAVFTFVSYTAQLAVTTLLGLLGMRLMASPALDVSDST